MPALKSSDPLWHKWLKIVPFGIFIGIGLIVAGLCCLCFQQTIEAHEKKCNGTTTKYNYVYINSVDYRDCGDVSGDACWNHTYVTCSCNVLLEVSKFIEGDVVLSYNLETFFDKKNRTGLLLSKDDSQLSGNLNTTVSPACSGPYDYDNGKPIAPCGALADAMFNDTLGAIYHTDTLVPSMTYGLLHDNEKIGFKNPPGDLQAALQNFTKPISWRNPIWELDKENSKNNGFENEAFIVWMRSSELPIRPIWRLNRTAEDMYAKGLPAHNYIINMNYQYPYSVYPGPRNLTLYREVKVEEPFCDVIPIAAQKAIDFDIGVTGIVIGVIFLFISTAVVLAYKVKAANEGKRIQPVNDSSPQKSINSPTPASKLNTEAIVSAIRECGDSDKKLLSETPVISKEVEPEQKPLKDIKEEEEYL